MPQAFVEVNQVEQFIPRIGKAVYGGNLMGIYSEFAPFPRLFVAYLFHSKIDIGYDLPKYIRGSILHSMNPKGVARWIDVQAVAQGLCLNKLSA
jgi:hypothetical protein